MACVASGCAGEASTPAPTPPPVDPCAATASLVLAPATEGANTVWRVAPKATDGCITTALDTHYVYRNRAITAKNRLLVFLPGTGAIPRNYRLILIEAAAQGYHAIGLSYPNETAVGDLCNMSQPTSLSCPGDVRRERLEGIDLSALVSIDRANSIENRLIKALKLLHSIAPTDGWGQYVSGDTLHWRNFSVAGHSQGSGFAAYIGKNRRVFRVGMFGGPSDYVIALAQVPTWLTFGASKTPASSFYGLTSPLDELNVYPLVQSIWVQLGLGTALDVTDVDVVPSPYANRRMLNSNATPRNPGLAIGPYHNMPVVDVNTPLVAPFVGPATFNPVWRYMLFP
jgi:hypothetical protein